METRSVHSSKDVLPQEPEVLLVFDFSEIYDGMSEVRSLLSEFPERSLETLTEIIGDLLEILEGGDAILGLHSQIALRAGETCLRFHLPDRFVELLITLRASKGQ